LKLKKNDGDAYYMWFLNLLQKGDTLNAISILDSASKYQKYNKDYHLMLIGFSTKFNLKETCIAGHDRLVRYFSHTTQYRINRGIQFYEYGEIEQAKKDFEYVLERNKNSGEAFYYLGKILKEIGDEKGAEKASDKAKKLGYPK
jgi:tetratricopeptide (TPR) repeat protein